jgi:hypothetical protein
MRSAKRISRVGSKLTVIVTLRERSKLDNSRPNRLGENIGIRARIR